MMSNLQLITDRQLIKLCLNDSEEAMEEFYRRFHAQIAECVATSLISCRFGGECLVNRQDQMNELVQKMYVFLLDDERRILRQLLRNKDVRTALHTLTKKFVLDSLRLFRSCRTASSFESRELAGKAKTFISSPVLIQSSWLPRQAY